MEVRFDKNYKACSGCRDYLARPNCQLFGLLGVMTHADDLHSLSDNSVERSVLQVEFARRNIKHECVLPCRATGLAPADIGNTFTTDPTETPIRVVRWGHLGDNWPYFRPNFVNMEAARAAATAQEVSRLAPGCSCSLHI